MALNKEKEKYICLIKIFNTMANGKIMFHMDLVYKGFKILFILECLVKVRKMVKVHCNYQMEVFSKAFLRITSQFQDS
jgi:hypothetical protein